MKLLLTALAFSRSARCGGVFAAVDSRPGEKPTQGSQLRTAMIAIVLSLVLLFATASWSSAQQLPLADQIPADAVAYFGWAGADSQSAVYHDSQLSAFLEHSNLPEIAREYVPKLWDQLAGKSDDPEIVKTLRKIAPVFWKRPIALYASIVTPAGADGTPAIDLALVIDGGEFAADLKSDLEKVLGHSPHVSVTIEGALITVNARPLGGTHDEKGADKLRLEHVLASAPRFTAAVKSLQASPSFAIYIDAQTIVEKANEAANQNPQAGAIWPKVRDALGIANVKSFALTAGFENGDWLIQSRLEAPGPRTGLLAAIEPQPIDPFLLARIPASAGSVCVYNFDAAKIFGTIGEAMASSKDSDTLFHQIAGGATVVLGRNFRRQILGPLGPQWVMYSDSTQHAAVLMNHPTDADASADSMVSTLFGLVNLANAQIPGARANPVANIDQKTTKGLDLTSAVTRLMSPTVTVKDKVLYWGLSSESVVNAANAPATPDGKDLLSSPDFLAAKKKLGVAQFGSFNYCDIPKTAPAAYANFGPAGDQVRQMLGMFQIELPRIQLPPVDQLRLTPALAVSWADGDGVYSKSICPFPGSTVLLGDPQQGMVAASTVSALVAVAVPAVQQARAAARRSVSMACEKQILLGMIMYANDHNGTLPADLGSIVSNGYMGANAVNLFLQPNSITKVPPEIATAPREKQAEWINEHAEYTLLISGKKMAQIQEPSRAVLVVPVNADQATEPVPVGFVDGHVEMCRPDRVKHLMHPDDPAGP